LAVYVTTAILASVALPYWAALILALELGLVATLLRRRVVSSRVLDWGAALGTVRLVFSVTFAALRSEQVSWLTALGPAGWRELPTAELVFAGVQELFSLLPVRAVVAVPLAFLVAVWSKRRADGGWQASAVAAACLPVLMLADRPFHEGLTPEEARPVALESNVGLYSIDVPAGAMARFSPPEGLSSEGRYDEVLLVVLESVGAPNLQEHLARRPDGAFARLWRRGLRFERVIAASNVSHMAQPSLLTSQEFTHRVGRHLPFPRSARAPWSFPAHFAAKGWQTYLESSQNETWLGMSAITLDQPWTHVRHAIDLPTDAVYRDACGTVKAFDSGTLARLEAVLEAARGPRFAYANLQNTHFPFVAEELPAGEVVHEALASTSFACGDFLDLPAEKLDVVRWRYDLAVDMSLERVAAFAERHPEALVIVTGDHPEHLIAGRGFGHSKFAIPAETDTFALLLAPDLPSRRVEETVSALDLLPTIIGLVNPDDYEPLPPELFQGVDVLRRVQPTVSFTTSYGLGAPQYAAVDDASRLQVSWDGRWCSGSETGCEELARALSFWVSCKSAFHARRHPPNVFEACTRLARDLFQTPTTIGTLTQRAPTLEREIAP
jgi:hypothetical protein